MSDLPDTSMIQQLRDIYAKHIDGAKAKFVQGGTVDAGVYTPDVDYGYEMPNGYSFNTPPSHAASSGRPAQVYAEGGDVDDYGSGRFTRTPAERRIVRERSSAMHVPERSAEWDRFLAHRGNPLSYGMEALSRLDNAAGTASKGEHSLYTIDNLASLAQPAHELGDQYGLPGRVIDALSTTASAIPGIGGAQKIASGFAPTMYRAANAIPSALERMTSWRPEGYAGGGKVSKIIKEIGNKFGDFQASRMQRAADETNLERISGEGLRKMFDPVQSGLFVSMPPEDFQSYAAPIPSHVARQTPYPRAYNVPGADRLTSSKQTQDWYLDNLAKLADTKGFYEAPELIIGKNNAGMTNVAEHEGRHRMMAMDRLGDPRALVQLPNQSMQSLPPDERVDYLTQKYFPHGAGTLVVPEDYRGPRIPRPIYSEPYAGGGKVLSLLAKGGRVDDDFNLYQSQFYKRGGSVVPLEEDRDFENLYMSQYFKRGGFFRGR